MISSILLIIITIFFPPVGVFLVAGCGADLCINILLTILGFFPGHIHAFYVEYIYFKRRDEARAGIYAPAPAPGVYSERVNNAGRHHGGGGAAYGGDVPQYQPIPPQQHQGYGTVAPPAAP